MYQDKLKKYKHKILFRGGSNQENTWNCECGTVNENAIIYCKECSGSKPLGLGLGLGLKSIKAPDSEELAYQQGVKIAEEEGYSHPSKFVKPSATEEELIQQDEWEERNAAYIAKIKKEAEAAKATGSNKKKSTPYLKGNEGKSPIPEFSLEEKEEEKKEKKEKKENGCIIV